MAYVFGTIINLQNRWSNPTNYWLPQTARSLAVHLVKLVNERASNFPNRQLLSTGQQTDILPPQHRSKLYVQVKKYQNSTPAYKTT